MMAPDYDRDEMEGDEGGPLPLSSVLSSFQELARSDDPAASLELPLPPARTVPRERLCRLRC